MPQRVFLIYAHEDNRYRVELRKTLRPFERRGVVEIWDDHEIKAGTDWSREINLQLDQVDIFIPLVSRDFINSEYIAGKELKHALQRHRDGTARVVPIIVRECTWQATELGKLEVLPAKGQAIKSWEDPDAAWVAVYRGLERVLAVDEESATTDDEVRESVATGAEERDAAAGVEYDAVGDVSRTATEGVTAGTSAKKRGSRAKRNWTWALVGIAGVIAAVAVTRVLDLWGTPDKNSGRISRADAAIERNVAAVNPELSRAATERLGSINLRLEEDCLDFRPNSLQLEPSGSLWLLTDGRRRMKTFPNRAEAERALAIIQHYRMNETCYVGRPGPSMEYLLVDGDAPSGSFGGEDCVSFNPTNLAVQRSGAQWALVDGSHSLLQFPNEDEAKQARAIIVKYGFTRLCFVGRPEPSFTYFRK